MCILPTTLLSSPVQSHDLLASIINTKLSRSNKECAIFGHLDVSLKKASKLYVEIASARFAWPAPLEDTKILVSKPIRT